MSALAKKILEIDRAYPPPEPSDESSPAEMGVPGDEWAELVALARAEVRAKRAAAVAIFRAERGARR